MDEPQGEAEPTLVESIISEYRAHNDYWVKAGAIWPVPCGDLPHGVYFGPDKDLFWLCLEIKAISWKMTELSLKMGEKPQTSVESPEPAAPIEPDRWNIRCNEYFGFCNLALPLYESRLGRLEDVVPHTLHGLAAKAAVIHSECLPFSKDETTATKVLRSIFRDIANIMGEHG